LRTPQDNCVESWFTRCRGDYLLGPADTESAWQALGMSPHEDAPVFKVPFEEREILVAAEPSTFFVTTHYKGHPFGFRSFWDARRAKAVERRNRVSRKINGLEFQCGIADARRMSRSAKKLCARRCARTGCYSIENALNQLPRIALRPPIGLRLRLRATHRIQHPQPRLRPPVVERASRTRQKSRFQ
jgi:hypothetical protein